MRRVVVTGVGAVTPLGATAQATWQRLLRGCSGVAELQRRSSDYEPHGISVGVAAEIKQAGHPQLAQLPPAERALLEYVPAPQTRKLGSSSGLPSNLSFALDSAAQALAAANGGVAGPGTSGSAVQRSLVEHHGCERVGVAVGAGISGLQDILANQAAMLDKGARRVSPYLVPYSLVNMAAGMISIAHGLQGPNHAVSTACATGAHAIGDAFRFIKHGDADVSLIPQGEGRRPAASLTKRETETAGNASIPKGGLSCGLGTAIGEVVWKPCSLLHSHVFPLTHSRPWSAVEQTPVLCLWLWLAFIGKIFAL